MSEVQHQPVYNIHPGEWYFGAEHAHLHTLLGSCVALTAWHPGLKIGGLCHYLLATSPCIALAHQPKSVTVIDGRYASNALAAMKTAMLRYAALKEFHLGLFGGGDMFPHTNASSIGFDNIAYAQEWLLNERVRPLRMDVGGAISRSVTLAIATGELHVKHYPMNKH